jgi:CRAL/TRIO domain
MATNTNTSNTNTNTAPSLEERWNEANFNAMAELWSLSENDRARMRDLQQRLQDLDHWKNDPFEVIRFFKAYNGKVTRAERALRHVLQWRRDHQMDHFLQRYGTPDSLFPQHWPVAVLNTTDRDQDPILVERFGATDYAGFLEEFGTDECLDYSALFVRELIEQRSFWGCYEEHVGRRVRQYTLIVDLEGGGLEFLRPTMIRYLQRLSHIAQVYYPGWAKVSGWR